MKQHILNVYRNKIHYFEPFTNEDVKMIMPYKTPEAIRKMIQRQLESKEVILWSKGIYFIAHPKKENYIPTEDVIMRLYIRRGVENEKIGYYSHEHLAEKLGFIEKSIKVSSVVTNKTSKNRVLKFDNGEQVELVVPRMKIDGFNGHLMQWLDLVTYAKKLSLDINEISAEMLNYLLETYKDRDYFNAVFIKSVLENYPDKTLSIILRSELKVLLDNEALNELKKNYDNQDEEAVFTQENGVGVRVKLRYEETITEFNGVLTIMKNIESLFTTGRLKALTMENLEITPNFAAKPVVTTDNFKKIIVSYDVEAEIKEFVIFLDGITIENIDDRSLSEKVAFAIFDRYGSNISVQELTIE